MNWDYVEMTKCQRVGACPNGIEATSPTIVKFYSESQNYIMTLNKQTNKNIYTIMTISKHKYNTFKEVSQIQKVRCVQCHLGALATR